MTDRLQELAATLAAGGPLDEADALALAAEPDILALGMLADDVRRRKHGDETTFVRVAEVAMPVAGGAVDLPEAAGEVRLRGPIDSRAGAVAAVRTLLGAAGAVPLSAFSLADIERAASADGSPLADWLRALRDAGLTLVAEAPIDGLRDAERALAAVRDAGLTVARVTVTRGTGAGGRLAQLQQVASLQRSVGGLRSFAPLATTWDAAVPSTGFDDVRQVAVARLMLEHVPSIQVDWRLYGPKLAQVALTVGADDLDAVSPIDDLSEGRRRSPIEEVRRNIRAASLVPIERDGNYERREA